jgi:hypothetical protein
MPDQPVNPTTRLVDIFDDGDERPARAEAVALA